MGLPTITYGQGWQSDCGDRSSWSANGAHDDDMSSTMTVVSGTVFDITVTAAVGNKKTYYELDITDIYSTSTYPNFTVRYKTSSNSIKAKVELVFTDASTQVIMPEYSSTTWKVFSATITEGKTIDKIRIYATMSTGSVYYDFLMTYMGIQTFTDGARALVNPRVKVATLVIPGRDTNIKQMLGRDNTLITVEGPMRSGKTWGGASLTYGEFLMHIIAEKKFQWFTSDQGNFKVVPMPEGFEFRQDNADTVQLRYVVRLQEYDVGDASVFGSPAYFGK